MAGGTARAPRSWVWDGERWAEEAPAGNGRADRAEAAPAEPGHPGEADRWRWDGEQWQPQDPPTQ